MAPLYGVWRKYAAYSRYLHRVQQRRCGINTTSHSRITVLFPCIMIIQDSVVARTPRGWRKRTTTSTRHDNKLTNKQGILPPTPTIIKLQRSLVTNQTQVCGLRSVTIRARAQAAMHVIFITMVTK